jgi:hypothetical protein
MKKGDTRGLSTVIATLLVILLVIVAITIVWGVIKNMISNTSEQISLASFTIDLEILSYQQTSDNVSIKVKRNAGEGELDGILFAIFDGENTHVFKKTNISLEPLEMKTFLIDYQGEIVSISISPIFTTESGKTTTGGIADTYYGTGNNGGGPISPGCQPDCVDKADCEDNGCGGHCGVECSGDTPYCNIPSDTCEADSGGQQRDCSCKSTICEGKTCSDKIGGHCDGTMKPECTNQLGNEVECGESLNSCGDCGDCGDIGYYCSNGGKCCLVGETSYGGKCCPSGYHSTDGQTCTSNCNHDVACFGKECGSDGCGGFCGYCDNLGPTWHCNSNNQLCEECVRNCNLRQCGPEPSGCGEDCGNCTLLPGYGPGYNCNNTFMCELCQPDCSGGRNCGPALNPEGCGDCGDNNGECIGQDTCIDGYCTPPEVSLNTGTIFSVWPYPVGRMYFDSGNLPTSGLDDYSMKHIKFSFSNGTLKTACLTIQDFVKPIFPPYDMSYIRLGVTSTNIETGDNYEIWETYDGCCKGNILCPSEGL